MGTTWDMWVELSSDFAAEARRRGVPTTKRLDGRWWDWDRDAWRFKVTYLWAEEAGELRLFPTITKRGRLVELGVGPQERPVRRDTQSGLELANDVERRTIKAALDRYIELNAVRD